MTISVASVLTNATTVLQDAGMDRWTSDELIAWINEGQRELIKLHPDAKTQTRDVQLLAGAVQLLPTDCLSVIDIAYNVNGDAITKCDRGALDIMTPGWGIKPVASYVKHWMIASDPQKYYVYPAQSNTPAMVTGIFAVYPGTVGATGNLDVRDIYATNLTNYILYRAFSKDAEFGGDAQRAVAYYQAFAS